MADRREYQRQYALEHKEAKRAADRERYLRKERQRYLDNRPERIALQKRIWEEKRDLRRSLLKEFPCHCCGLLDPDLIEWHHVEPENKLFTLFGNKCTNDLKWWEECLKCIPVCCNCHKKIHKEKLCLIPQTFPIG